LLARLFRRKIIAIRTAWIALSFDELAAYGFPFPGKREIVRMRDLEPLLLAGLDHQGRSFAVQRLNRGRAFDGGSTAAQGRQENYKK
jgi:hypothetical protein